MIIPRKLGGSRPIYALAFDAANIHTAHEAQKQEDRAGRIARSISARGLEDDVVTCQVGPGRAAGAASAERRAR
jgi:hypothetical protein